MLTTKERAKAVGERIIAARKRKGMSQVDLAKKLAKRYDSDPETERRSLGNNERGTYAPRLHRLQAIAEATEQPLEFFAVEEGGDGRPFVMRPDDMTLDDFLRTRVRQILAEVSEGVEA